jgi:hypothetical protein
MNIYNQTTKLALALTLLSVPCAAVEVKCPTEYSASEPSPLRGYGGNNFFGTLKIKGGSTLVFHNTHTRLPHNYLIECHYPNGLTSLLAVPDDLYTCELDKGTKKVDCTNK